MRRARKGTGVARSVSIEFAACPLVGQVVLLFSQLQAQAFRPYRPQGFVQLPGESFPLKEGILNDCMRLCVAEGRLDGVYGSAL